MKVKKTPKVKKFHEKYEREDGIRHVVPMCDTRWVTNETLALGQKCLQWSVIC